MIQELQSQLQAKISEKDAMIQKLQSLWSLKMQGVGLGIIVLHPCIKISLINTCLQG
jgi:hypothetical protein